MTLITQRRMYEDEKYPVAFPRDTDFHRFQYTDTYRSLSTTSLQWSIFARESDHLINAYLFFGSLCSWLSAQA